VETIAIITVILIGAVVLGYFLAITQLPMKLAQLLADSGLSPTSIMLMIIAAYLIMGAFMDELAMILLTVPGRAGHRLRPDLVRGDHRHRLAGRHDRAASGAQRVRHLRHGERRAPCRTSIAASCHSLWP
jgi:hypothetical protein